ncbi:MAG: ATP-binding protein [Candidatus Omnitrophica bacterium]|nr:ATP-binding protein [Candidatus Omnitrophota bacterium]
MLAASVFVLFFNFLVYFKNRKSKVNFSFAIFGVFISIWLFSFAVGYCVKDLSEKIYWFRLGYIGIIGIPASFYSFVYYLTRREKDRIVVFLNYLIALLFVILNFTKFPLVVGLFSYEWGYYPNTFVLNHFIFLIFFISLFSISNFLMTVRLLRGGDKFNEIERTRIKYALFGSVVGSLGALDFIASYGINFPPVGFIFMFLYPIIFGYAILKYRFLDVTVAITRTGAFVFVYSIVLGIPFAMALGWKQTLVAWLGDLWWLIPLVSSTLLATGGPFLYLFIQKKAENQLLRDQKRYQATLKQASSGMTRIKDLKKLLNLIVYILSRTINLDHACIYLYDSRKKEYLLKAARGKSLDSFDCVIKKHSTFIRYLEKVNAPIVYEEIKQRMHDYGGQEYKEVEEGMRSLQAEVVVPIFTEKQLIAIGILGKKKSKEMYSQDDLAVFTILGNQVALAIENAQFYEESKKTQAQLFQAEKMATIGTMADGLSHQINNRLHALGFIAGDALDSIKLKAETANQSSEEIKELLRDVTGALLKIQENVRQGGEIVQGLLRYTRKGEEGFCSVDFRKLVDASIEMAQFKIKKDQLTIIKDYDSNVPAICGNFTQLQEVMFNIIDNAYDAVMQRKSEEKDPHYKAKIQISTRRTDGFLEISILDNGIGIKEEDQNKLFTPFFTTKLSSKKGTGLGLYVIQKIVEENHRGKVFMSSENNIGTLTILKLPIFKK